MNDSELRGVVLKQLYEIRHTHGLVPVPESLSVPGVALPVLGNIAHQLAQQGLIDFHTVLGPYYSGPAKITASGVDVVEGSRAPPIPIVIHQSISVHGSTNVQIGKGNVQNVSGIDQFNLAIEQSSATQNEKAEAKSLLKQLSENKLLAALLAKWGLDLG